MDTIIKYLLLALFFIFPVYSYAGTAHYVDADAAGGGDGSWATPFKTVDEVNAHAFSTGDDVYFQVGDTFSLGSTDELRIDWVGTSGDRVIVGAYEGEGDFTLEGGETLPIIDGASQGVGNYNGIEVVNGTSTTVYTTIENIRVNVASQYGIVFSKSNDFVVDNCYIYRSKAQGIIIARSHTGTISNNTVQQASYLSSPGAGIEVNATDTEDSTYGVTVNNNLVYHCYEGIGIYNRAKEITIEYNTVYDCRVFHIFIESSKDNIVRYNLVYETDNPLSGDGKDMLVVIDNESRHSYCYQGGNKIYGNLIAAGRYGIEFEDHNDCSNDNNLIYNNTIVDNTLYNIHYDTTYLPDGDWSGNEIKNNISWILDGGGAHISHCSPSSFTFDYNLWDSDPGTGNCDAANDPVNGSPLLTKTSDWQSLGAGSVDGTEFSLLTGSPAIDAGVDLGVTYDDGIDPDNVDFTATPISVSLLDQDDYGAGWDIGAMVFNLFVSGMSPANGDTEVALSVVPSWTNPTGTVTNNIIFGVSGSAVTVSSGSLETSYDPGGLVVDTSYDLRVDAVHAGGTQSGVTNTWTTTSGPPVQEGKRISGKYSKYGVSGKFLKDGVSIK